MRKKDPYFFVRWSLVVLCGSYGVWVAQGWVGVVSCISGGLLFAFVANFVMKRKKSKIANNRNQSSGT